MTRGNGMKTCYLVEWMNDDFPVIKKWTYLTEGLGSNEE